MFGGVTLLIRWFQAKQICTGPILHVCLHNNACNGILMVRSDVAWHTLQATCGIEENGVADEATWQALLGHNIKPVAPPVDVSGLPDHSSVFLAEGMVTLLRIVTQPACNLPADSQVISSAAAVSCIDEKLARRVYRHTMYQACLLLGVMLQVRKCLHGVESRVQSYC